RHTRSYGDWSSDVCSSDLHAACIAIVRKALQDRARVDAAGADWHGQIAAGDAVLEQVQVLRRAVYGRLVGHDVLEFHADDPRSRSEERRVGKGCRCRGWAY